MRTLLKRTGAATLLLCACSANDSKEAGGAGGSDVGAANGGQLIQGASGSRAGAFSAGGAASAGAASGGAANGGAANGGALTGSSGAASLTCATNVWSHLESCGWPGPANTGPDLARCPGGLRELGGPSMPTIRVDQDGQLIECANIRGSLRVTGRDVTIRHSRVDYDSGKRGEAANGTAAIVVDDGASANIDHVAIDGLEGAHTCILHQGVAMSVRNVDCHGVDDGIFTWASSEEAGDDFSIEDSYIHDLTPLTANGHMDGFQTEGAKHGVIRHNTFDMSARGTSAIAIWNSQKSSRDILVEGNLMAGGGATVYAEDYHPSEASPQGGNSVTEIRFSNNTFSMHVAECVGSYFVWFSRPQLLYGGGPTDGWKRAGNVVLETGENVDAENPHVGGRLCN